MKPWETMMKWTKFKDEYPEKGNDVLYYDTINDLLVAAYVEEKKITSQDYYCNVGGEGYDCGWIRDSCSCGLKILPDDMWMYFPNKPHKDKE